MSVGNSGLAVTGDGAGKTLSMLALKLFYDLTLYTALSFIKGNFISCAFGDFDVC